MTYYVILQQKTFKAPDGEGGMQHVEAWVEVAKELGNGRKAAIRKYLARQELEPDGGTVQPAVFLAIPARSYVPTQGHEEVQRRFVID